MGSRLLEYYYAKRGFEKKNIMAAKQQLNDDKTQELDDSSSSKKAFRVKPGILEERGTVLFLSKFSEKCVTNRRLIVFYLHVFFCKVRFFFHLLKFQIM